MSRPTDEEIAWEVAQCRGMDKKFPVSCPDATGVIVALADDLDAAVALLRETRRDYCRAFTVGSAMTDECESKPPCYEHRKAAILANHPAPAKATDGPKETTDE